jgi:hypothetical protein
VGVDATTPDPVVFPTVVVVGVAPARSPRLTERYPAYRVGSLSGREREETVDHVRLSPGVDPSALPGLDSVHPSLVRDTVRILLAAGCPTIDVVLARSPTLSPWDVGEPGAVALLRPVVEALTAVPVLFPDAAGPARVGLIEAPIEDRLRNLVQTVGVWAPTLRRSFQVGVVDLPQAPDDLSDAALEAMSRTDVVACAWEGEGTALRAHGWRNSAAVVGGLIATTTSPAASLIGRTLALPPGRDPGAGGRALELGMEPMRRTVPTSIEHGVAKVRLSRAGDSAELITEHALRGLPGTWPAPLMHAVKLIHDRLIFASNLFVFREANGAQAFLLQSALRMALREFEDAGILSGPTADEPAQIQVGYQGGPEMPSLIANVSAFVRPWVHKLELQLAVRPGDTVRSEVSA